MPAAATQEAQQREVVHAAKTLDEATPLFRRPFTPETVSFKIQVNPKKINTPEGEKWKKGLVVVYIEARTAAERLNIGTPGAWEDDYGDLFPAGSKGFGVKCILTVFDRRRADVSFVSSAELEKEGDKALKGVHSDAFKRACVKYGIGAFLYFTPKLYVEASELQFVGQKWYLPSATEVKLRKRYAAWLGTLAVKERFGDPLDHGDVTEAQGDIEATPPELPPDAEEGAPAPAENAEQPAAEAPAQAAAPDADAEADAALAAAEDPLVALRVAYAESSCTKAEYVAKLTQMGLSDIQEAVPEQIAELSAFFASRTPAS